MKRILTLLLLFGITTTIHAESGDEVIVVYNSRVPESKQVADYYASRRHVPADQIFGFALTTDETISREDFTDKLQKPLAKALEAKKLWHIAPEIGPVTNAHSGNLIWKVQKSKIRYAVMCFGVPVRIESNSGIKEPVEETMRPELRRNGAAVDNELALLPCIKQDLPLAGPIGNRYYAATNATSLDPTNGILLVTRLDGPSASIARGLVDKALEAESNGLCGRAYFDSRGLATNSPYFMGDEWILGAAKVCQQFAGFDTVIDANPGTFPADFPMSQIAIYCGWYGENASGPFAQKHVEFMPGAFAYHLHSFSAATIRSTTQRWVGPFLAEGAAATMGSVDEPYLSGTPDVAVFCARWVVGGFTFGEAAYACQQTLSWQTTVIGDPLYCPFKRTLAERLREKDGTNSNSADWNYVRLLNLNLAEGRRPTEAAIFLEGLALTKKSAVLKEKLGDLYAAIGKPSSAIEAYEDALKLGPSLLQEVRLRLELADRLPEAGRNQEAYNELKALLAEYPDYPGKPTVLKTLIDLANKLGNKDAAAALERQTNL